MQRLVGLFIALFLLSAFFWLIESLFAANPAQPKLHRRRGFRTDLVYWFMTPLLTRSISQIGLAVILIIIYRQDIAGIQQMLAERDTLLAGQPLGLQAMEMLLIGDLIGYWTHRAFHRGRLWKFHAIHHCSTDLDWLSAVRLHPVNHWLSRWIQASPLIAMGFSPLAVAAYVPFLTFYAWRPGLAARGPRTQQATIGRRRKRRESMRESNSAAATGLCHSWRTWSWTRPTRSFRLLPTRAHRACSRTPSSSRNRIGRPGVE
jgi:hypothetical protein